jgi:hypothetical protein
MRSRVAVARRMRWRSVALAGLLVFAVGQAEAAGTKPADVAAAFCATRVAGDEEGVRSLLSPTLLSAITEAETRNLAIAEAAPDEKPPFGDGIPYQSYPDLPHGCTADATETVGEAVHVTVSLSLTSAPTAGWRDTLVLVPAEGGYRIDDIIFRGAPDGSEAPTLRSTLRDAFDQ